jgi:hypothetical protein
VPLEGEAGRVDGAAAPSRRMSVLPTSERTGAGRVAGRAADEGGVGAGDSTRAFFAACGEEAAVAVAAAALTSTPFDGRVVAGTATASPARQRQTPANTAATARVVCKCRTVTRAVPRPRGLLPWPPPRSR